MMNDQNLSKEALIKKVTELQEELDTLKAAKEHLNLEFELASEENLINKVLLNFYLENSPLAIIEWDTDFIVHRWAGAAEKIFGWSAHETIGRPLTELKMFYELDIPNARRILERLKNLSDRTICSVHRNYRKEREVIHCEWYTTVMKGAEGEKLTVLSMVSDITGKKQAELLLRESEERLISVQEVASVGYWETDLLNFHVTWSEETYRIFELDHNQFGSSHPDFLNYVHPDDKEKANTALFESYNSPTINTLVHRIITPGGKIKHVEERWRIILNDQGRPERALGTCREVARQVQ